jgi:DNA-directed RNA polymerase specialized sigma24 family protein
VSLIEDRYEQLCALASTAARSAKRRYPAIDYDDLQQVALMWCVEHPRKLNAYLTDDDSRRGIRMLTASMRNAAKKYAREARAQHFGYFLEDEVWYSKRMLKGDGNKPGLLHYVFDQENWRKAPPSDGAGRGKGDPAEGGGWLTSMCDLSAAIDALGSDDKAVVQEHFRFGVTYDQLGQRMGCSKATVAKRIDRAVRRIQDYLGGQRPHDDPAEDGTDVSSAEAHWVGTRRAISNAHARALTANAYSGDYDTTRQW